MNPFAFSELSDELVVRELDTYFTRDHETTAGLLARMAEFDERRLYLPAGYPSMLAYCVARGNFTEQAALKRIRVARTARRFPAIFHGLAAGTLNLSGALLLSPYLTEQNAHDLLAAAAGRSKSEIDQLLADRFPRSEAFTWVESTPVNGGGEVSPGTVEPVGRAQLSPGTVATVNGVDKVTPLSSQSAMVQLTMDRETQEAVRYARPLLGSKAGDLSAMFKQAMRLLVREAEKRRFAATDRPRKNTRQSQNPRYVPDNVRRTVFERDGGRCTFTSDDGHRCQAGTHLEFDHITAVANGGEATADNIRLLCRAHNQYAAERTFGSEFMRHKRIGAKEFREAAVREAERKAARRKPVEHEDTDVVPWLRALKFSAAEARMAAESCADMPADATLEERIKRALQCIRVRGTKHVPAPAPAPALVDVPAPAPVDIAGPMRVGETPAPGSTGALSIPAGAAAAP